MMKDKTYSSLRALSESELIKEFDRVFQNAEGGLMFLRDELAHRETDKQFRQMHDLTTRVTKLTWFIAICTVAQFVCAVLQTLAVISVSR